jgi:YD repeat-containing protein
MTNNRCLHPFLALIVLVLANGTYGQQLRVNSNDSDRSILVWNRYPSAPLFVAQKGEAQIDPGLGLIYPERGFSVSLLQPLSFSSASGYFVWWVTLENQPGQRMICFSRQSNGHFRAAAIAAELQDLGELKLIKVDGGSKFLFTLAGDGQLRLVSVTNAAQRQLFVEYTAAGQVERIRDDLAREATPQYEGEQVRQLTQTWFEHGNKFLTAAILK